jgi:hypothetical protein
LVVADAARPDAFVIAKVNRRHDELLAAPREPDPRCVAVSSADPTTAELFNHPGSAAADRARIVASPSYVSLLRRCAAAFLDLPCCVACPFGDDLAPVIVVSLTVDGATDAAPVSLIGLLYRRRAGRLRRSTRDRLGTVTSLTAT